MEYSMEKALPGLERTPAVLQQLLEGIDEAWIYGNEGPETWAPFDVVGHLLHGERTDWMARIKKCLGDDAEAKNFTPFDRFAQLRESEGKTLTQLLDAFAAARKQNLDELRSMNLTETDFDKTGIHPVFGTVTLRQLLSTWVAHDMTHIAQIVRVMAKQYKEAVGPWAEYLSIMHR